MEKLQNEGYFLWAVVLQTTIEFSRTTKYPGQQLSLTAIYVKKIRRVNLTKAFYS